MILEKEDLIPQKMTHRKVHSQGSIPFSWEEKPGISKSCFQDYPTADIDLRALNLRPQSFLSEPKIPPPPPCRPAQAPRRSSSAKGHQWLNDPFLVAYKECTKRVEVGKFQTGRDKDFECKLRKSKFLFPCTSSYDVSDSFVKVSRLPPLPKRPSCTENMDINTKHP